MKHKDVNDLRRVLIVDDDQDIRLALRALLRDAGFDVIGEAGEGVRAMELMEKHHPSLVMLDIMMPGVSGLDVLTDIKEKYPLTQVVMISGDATSDHVTTAMERGASGFIVKPFNFNNVIKNIKRALIEAATAAKNIATIPQVPAKGLLEQNEKKAGESAPVEKAVDSNSSSK